MEICFIIIQHILIRRKFVQAPFKCVNRFHRNYSDLRKCRRWLRVYGLLSPQIMCGKCGSLMDERPYSRSQYGTASCGELAMSISGLPCDGIGSKRITFWSRSLFTRLSVRVAARRMHDIHGRPCALCSVHQTVIHTTKTLRPLAMSDLSSKLLEITCPRCSHS